MSDPDHVALVRQGAAAVNRFAADNPGLGGQRICVSPLTFDGARWDRAEIERLLSLINLNSDWEVRYEIVPKRSDA